MKAVRVIWDTGNNQVPEITDYQFSVAIDYLSEDIEASVELLEMKISSDLYYNVLKYGTKGESL